MEVLPLEQTDIAKIAERLKQGDVIVYPTETCYGLGCDATNQEAVDRLFAIKERQKEKPVLVVVPDIDQLVEYIDWTPELDTISQRYWPGALTVVANLREEHPFAVGVAAADNTLAFRVTAHPFAAELSEALGRPLVSTSANIAKQASPYDVEQVLAMYEGREQQPDVIVNAGPLPEESPSTIVKIHNHTVTALRQGEVIVEL